VAEGRAAVARARAKASYVAMPSASSPETDPRALGSVVHLLRRRAAECGDAEFLRFSGHAVTFAEAEAESSRRAAAIRALGLLPGDRLALMLPNGLDFPLTWLAAARAGTPVVAVNPAYGEEDLAYVLADSGARAAVAGAAELPKLERARPRCPGLEWTGGPEDLPRVAAGEPVQPPSLDGPAADTVVSLQYTSGTTGFPKGCVLTHGYWLRLAATIRAYGTLGPGDVALTAQPFYYMDPIWNMVLCLLAGMPLAILPRFSVSTFWRQVGEERATFFYCIGTMPSYLFQAPADPELDRGHRVRLVLCSGIPERHHAAFEERWGCPWRETYGTTELGVVLMVPPGDTGSVGSGAMGEPVPGREVRVVDEEGHPVADGDAGELQVRGPDTMLGYWTPAGPDTGWLTEDGWASTGDRVRHEEHGYRHLGRLKDVIRRAGENIAAAEVEAALRDHPLVRAAACVAVPDELRGEEVLAFVQLTRDAGVDEAPPETLAEFLERRLAPFKVPRYWSYVDSFPLTPSQKIAKALLVPDGGDPCSGAWDRRDGRWR
jgi:acyl-CoA synthetase (AMP-forming)/AMP-acid ligase II